MTVQEMVSVNNVLAANSTDITGLVYVEIEALLRKAWSGNEPFDLKFDMNKDHDKGMMLCYLYYNEKNEKYKIALMLDGTNILVYLLVEKGETLTVVPNGFNLIKQDPKCEFPGEMYKGDKTYSVLNDDLSYLITNVVTLLQESKK